jgi:imidazolonepropionase-like amidohydrolase
VLCPSSVLALLLIALCQVSLGQDYDIEVPGQPPSIPIPKGVTLFQNVRIFDGTRPTLSAPSNVLIRGNTIERISASPITVDANANVQVIAGNGRVLMPGLIDAHWHSFMAATPQLVLMTSEPSTSIF